MTYLGDVRLGKTLDVKFCTVGTTGAPTTLAGSPTVAAYPDNSTTEITAGITLTVDFDARTGLHNVRVVASGGNGYATATNYALVITAGTVGGTSVVGYVIGHFSIENRSALMPATADRTLVVDAAGLADANAVKVGPTGAGTAQTAGDLKTLIDTVDNFVDTEIADIQARLPAGLVGGRMDASVGAMAAGVVTAAAVATGAIDADALAADVITDIWQGTALTEAYAAIGAAATPAQLLYMIYAALAEHGIIGATITARKLDRTTTAMTFTLAPDGTNPTSRTRAT